MKEKYIVDMVGSYYVLPINSAYSSVVSSSGADIATQLSNEEASLIVKERDILIDALVMAINANGSNDYDVFDLIRNKLYKSN